MSVLVDEDTRVSQQLSAPPLASRGEVGLSADGMGALRRLHATLSSPGIGLPSGTTA